MQIGLLKMWSFVICALILITTASFHGTETQSMPDVSIFKGSDLTADELARLLGVYVWKLDVSLPDDAERISIKLEKQEKGQEKQDLEGGIDTIITPNIEHQIMIAIMPINGGISSAENVRISINGFGMTSSGIRDNPLKNLGIGKPGLPEKNADGTFSLIGGYKGSTIDTPISKTADMLISLRIEPK